MAHVKEHTRMSKQGKLSFVHGFDDKRQAHSDDQKKDSGKNKKPPVKHVIKAADPGMIKMRETITGMLRTEEGRKEFTEKIKAGGFSKTLPEVLNLYGVEQGAHHPLPDAFDHTMELFKHLPKDAGDNVLWATLLHDIGKAVTQMHHQDRGVIFDGHEFAGYKMVGKVLNRLGFAKKDADEISYLVLHHGNLRTQILRGQTADAAKFIKHPHFESLLTVHKADVQASGRDPKEVVDRTAKLIHTEGFRKDLYENVAKDLKADRQVELNDDGSVSLYLGNDKLVDKQGNVSSKVKEHAAEALKRNGLDQDMEITTEYDPKTKWIAVHFDPKVDKTENT